FIPPAGGGIYLFTGASASLTNTIVAGNAGGDIHGSITGDNNLIGGDPLLGPLGNYGGPTLTLPLLPGSPAIGGGAARPRPPATDQRGRPRPTSGPVDIGAFQSQGFTLTPVNGSTPQSALVNAAFANPLAVTVTAKDPVEPVDGGGVTFSAPS